MAQHMGENRITSHFLCADMMHTISTVYVHLLRECLTGAVASELAFCYRHFEHTHNKRCAVGQDLSAPTCVYGCLRHVRNAHAYMRYLHDKKTIHT